jgi:hypothetical protein
MRSLTKFEFVVVLISALWLAGRIFPGTSVADYVGGILATWIGCFAFGFFILWVKNDGGISW